MVANTHKCWHQVTSVGKISCELLNTFLQIFQKAMITSKALCLLESTPFKMVTTAHKNGCNSANLTDTEVKFGVEVAESHPHHSL